MPGTHDKSSPLYKGIGKYKKKAKGKRGFKMKSPFRNDPQKDPNYKDTVGSTTFGKVDFDTDPGVKNLIAAGAPSDVINKARENAKAEYKKKYS